MEEGLVPYTFVDIIKKWILSVISFPLLLYWVLNRGEYGLIDNADLVIHEGGHFVFRFFGQYIYTLGGTLMQIIIPLIIVIYFIKHTYRPGVQIFLIWLGQNLINISVYASDAVTQKLPLLGGNKVYHDWHYLLSQINMLDYSAEIGYFFFGLAILIFIVSLLSPIIIDE